jgi:hypothetical protein
MEEAKSGRWARLIDILRRYGSGALGVLGLGLSVYFFWYQEYGKVGEVAVAIKGEGSVLTVQRQVPDLDMLYMGASLVEMGKSLRFYSVQVTNTGPVHLPKSFFDEQVPWGFRLHGGEILQISKIEFSTSALSNMKPALVGRDAIRLQPVNFDTADWVRIDFLALSEANTEPKLEAEGRISGTKLVVRDETPSSQNYFVQAFGGSAYVQLGRLVGYALLFIVALIGLVLMGVLIAFTTDMTKSALRGRHVRRLEPNLPSSNAARALTNLYIEAGPHELAALVNALSTDKGLAALESTASLGRRLRAPLDDIPLRSENRFPRSHQSVIAAEQAGVLTEKGEVDHSKVESAKTLGLGLIAKLKEAGYPESEIAFSKIKGRDQEALLTEPEK